MSKKDIGLKLKLIQYHIGLAQTDTYQAYHHYSTQQLEKQLIVCFTYINKLNKYM